MDNEPMVPEPPMDGPEEDMPTIGDMDDTEKAPIESESENGEINDIFSKLDTEKQAAVIKYAKSMVNDKEGEEDVPPVDETPDMPMEGKKSMDSIINEIINNILSDDYDEEDREDDKIRNKKVSQDNPNITSKQTV